MKFGETTRGTKRYSKRFLTENEYSMDFMASGSKAEMHSWQHDQILQYKIQNGGRRPPKNLSDW